LRRSSLRRTGGKHIAHITRRNGRWQAAWRVDGRERTKTFDRRIDAERWLTSVEHSKLAGTYVDPQAGRVTFKEFAEEWRRVQTHREGTSRSVEQQLRLHVYPVIGSRPIAAIRPSEIQALVHQLGQQLSASTVAVTYSRVTAVFNAAVRDRVIVASPCPGMTPARPHGNGRLEVLEPVQVQRLTTAMPERYRALVTAGAGLGLRPGELFGLAVDRVDFLRRSVRVDQQVVRTDEGGVRPGPLKTRASYRSVPLPDVVADELAHHLSHWPAHSDLGLVFTTSTGGPVQQHPFATVWATARKQAGLPDWATPHDLRHFYASLLIRAGASVKVVHARLGHSSARTTLDTYAHLWPDEEDRTRAAVDEYLQPTADLPRTAAAT
jgi:integrase